MIALGSAYIAYWFDPQGTSLSILKLLSAAIFVLDAAIILVSTYLWRPLWKLIPLLPSLIFPDLNGIWEGRIIFESSTGETKLKAKARIRQSLWSIHIDLYSETSKSHTLVAYPTSEAGNQVLYYVYHNTPKNPQFPEYKGTSLLTIKRGTTPSQLSGHYFTVRGTIGRVELKRVSDNPNGKYEMW